MTELQSDKGLTEKAPKVSVDVQGPLLPTRFNFNPSMYK